MGLGERDTVTTIAFIGLGNMGAPMASNLLKSGNRLVGFDLSAESVKLAAARGIPVAKDPKSAVEGADVVITMLPSGKHVRMVWSGLLPLVPKGTLFIDCSTIDVESARAVHDMAKEKGMASLDAPVSGGTGGAQNASLTFMVGGEKAAFDRGRPIIERMGKKIVHCGAGGAGQAAKICNNMLLGISMIGASEAFVLAEKLGLSHKALFDVISTSSGQCWSVTTYCPVPGPVPASPANSGYKPGFAAKLMLKDLQLASEAALHAGAATPLGAAAANLYALYAAAGHAEDDFSGIVNMLRGNVSETGP